MDDRSGLEDLNSPPIHSGLTVCTAEVLSRLDITTVKDGQFLEAESTRRKESDENSQRTQGWNTIPSWNEFAKLKLDKSTLEQSPFHYYNFKISYKPTWKISASTYPRSETQC